MSSPSSSYVMCMEIHAIVGVIMMAGWIGFLIGLATGSPPDTLKNGVIARIGKYLVGHLKGVVGGSRSYSSHNRGSRGRAPTNSHVSERQPKADFQSARDSSHTPLHAPSFEHLIPQTRTPPLRSQEGEGEREGER